MRRGLFKSRQGGAGAGLEAGRGGGPSRWAALAPKCAARKVGSVGFARGAMLLRPLRSWASRALRRDRPRSPASSPGSLGAQRWAWPRGNASLSPPRWRPGGGPQSHSAPSARGTSLNPKPLLRGAGVSSGGLGGGAGRSLAGVPDASRQGAGGALGLRAQLLSRAGEPSKERKEPPPPRFLGPFFWPWGRCRRAVGGLGSVRSFSRWEWRPSPSEVRAPVVAKFWRSLASGCSVAPENPCGVGGPRCQPRACRRSLSPVLKPTPGFQWLARQPLLHRSYEWRSLCVLTSWTPISEDHKYKMCGKRKAEYTK